MAKADKEKNPNMATVPVSSNELEGRLEEEREALGDTLDELRSTLRRDFDVRRQLSEHVAVTLSVAAGLGLIIGRALRTMMS